MTCKGLNEFVRTLALGVMILLIGVTVSVTPAFAGSSGSWTATGTRQCVSRVRGLLCYALSSIGSLTPDLVRLFDSCCCALSL